jgi:ribosome-associated translation inhibitor RaiA
MEVHFHAHHAVVSEHMRKRAEREVRRAAARIPRVVEAIVRFEQDGLVRRVSLTLRAPQNHDLLARAEGRWFGPTLALAVSRVKSQASRERIALPKGRARQLARERSRA